MPRYLVSFDEGTMVVPDDDLPAVAAAAHQVVHELQAAGAWIFGGGIVGAPASVVATDGTVTVSPYPGTKAVLGGFSIIDVTSRDEALRWAAKLARACRCAQEVREIMADPEV